MVKNKNEVAHQDAEGYAIFLVSLKERIQNSQQRAALAVNGELILLYWDIGNEILKRQAEQGWGAKVIEKLATDLKTAFPELKGFSTRNLKYMKAFANSWADFPIGQQLAAQLPWFHHCLLLDKINDRDTIRWYAQACIEHGWSRAVLQFQIESKLHIRQGAAPNNFTKNLAAPQSDLAKAVLKDPYCS